MTTYRYDDVFFDYVDLGSARSAAAVIPVIIGLLKPSSVLDVGSGCQTASERDVVSACNWDPSC